MRACWLKCVGRDWSISADYIWLNYSDANSVSNISAFKVRKAVRTLARICDVPYHRQPLTPQLRHHMAASVAQLVEHRSRKAGVTGSSPVAGSIAQDSRLRAAFLLPISGEHPPAQAQRRW